MAMNANVMSNLTVEDEDCLKWQRECYGCTQDQLIANIKTHARFTSSPEMLVGSMLSDVQEILARIGDDAESRERHKEMARQTLNRAKFIVFNPETMRTIFKTSQ